MGNGEAELGGFLEAAGRSLGDAQRQLTGAEADPTVPTTMAISEVALEVKATLEQAPSGAVALRPVSSDDARAGGIAPELLSTVRVRYVAVADETGGGAQAPRPARSEAAAIEEVRRRDDVAALDLILGGLEFDATFVPEAGRWLVQASDDQGRVVREVVVSDSED